MNHCRGPYNDLREIILTGIPSSPTHHSVSACCFAVSSCCQKASNNAQDFSDRYVFLKTGWNALAFGVSEMLKPFCAELLKVAEVKERSG